MIDLGRFRDIEAFALAAEDAEPLAPMVKWSESVAFPATADDFAGEAIWVICCSGMKFAVARLIRDRVFAALLAGDPVRSRFNHPGKAAAIEMIWRDREQLFAALKAANDKLAFCRPLPWIGEITQYHLAKNIGLDVAKPDVHLQRLADAEGTTAQALCERLARETGYRVATVDLILWYACAHGVIDSRRVRSAGIKVVEVMG